ncbi:MAG: hypothetical protein JXB45_03000 [Candidatus Krumholzibacteriota bacterium]|nr:hypothetical protein [Candidatus Krumholzibacteriota bacterium]
MPLVLIIILGWEKAASGDGFAPGADSAPRPKIARVRWTGARLFGADELEEGSYLRSGAFYSDSLLQRELGRIDSLYFSQGWLSVEAVVDTGVTNGSVDIRIGLFEGERARIGKISIGGERIGDGGKEAGYISLREGDRFDPRKLSESMAGLLDFYINSGYPYAQVWLTGFTFQADSHTVELSLSTYPGEKAVLAGILFEGLSKTDSTFARRISRLKRGETFREKKLLLARDYLIASGLFASVEEPEIVRSPGGGVEVVMTVKERKRPHSFQGAFGFSKKDNGDYQMNGSLELELRNIAGSGRNARFNWLNDGQKYSRAELFFSEPFLFASPLKLEVELQQVVHDTLYDMISAGAYIRLPLGPKFSLLAGMAGDRNIPGESSTLRKSFRQRYRLGISKDSGSALRFQLHLDGAHKRNSFSDGSEDNEGQMLYRLEGALKINTWKNQAFHGRLVSEAVFSSGDVPLSEMYPLGGARSLRGYRENQFRGERVNWINLEYRLGEESRLFLFDDIGGWYRDGEGWTFRNGLGFGLRSVSQLGIVELSFGVGERIDLESTLIHISLIENF